MRLTAIAAIAIALAALVLGAGLPSARGVQTAASKVAIANPQKILVQIQKTRDLQSQMQTRLNALKQQQEIKANEIRDLQAKRDLLNPNTPGRASIQSELVEKTMTLQVWIGVRKHEIEQAQKEQTLAVYGEIAAAVAKVAEKKGIEIVLAEQKPEMPADLEQATVQQLQTVLGQRNILYAKAVADISDAVITQMDADYKSGGQ